MSDETPMSSLVYITGHYSKRATTHNSDYPHDIITVSS